MSGSTSGHLRFEFEKRPIPLSPEALAVFFRLMRDRSVSVRLIGAKRPVRGRLVGHQEGVVVVERLDGEKRIIDISEIALLERDELAAEAPLTFDPLRTPVRIPEYDCD